MLGVEFALLVVSGCLIVAVVAITVLAFCYIQKCKLTEELRAECMESFSDVRRLHKQILSIEELSESRLNAYNDLKSKTDEFVDKLNSKIDPRV